MKYLQQQLRFGLGLLAITLTPDMFTETSDLCSALPHCICHSCYTTGSTAIGLAAGGNAICRVEPAFSSSTAGLCGFAVSPIETTCIRQYNASQLRVCVARTQMRGVRPSDCALAKAEQSFRNQTCSGCGMSFVLSLVITTRLSIDSNVECNKVSAHLQGEQAPATLRGRG